MTEIQSVAMFNAVTEFDRRESKKKHYNHYALGHYARALKRVRHIAESGHSLRSAIVVCFNDRLRDVVLKSVGEKPAEKWEELRYRDASRCGDAFDYLEVAE